jgi:hypothetical protein
MSWIMTYTGHKVDPLNPNPDDIVIEDIAHALANICRFNGHVKHFYSVGQHALLCAASFLEEIGASNFDELGSFDNAKVLALLLHDASEAYLCDVPKPIKPHMPGYAELEDRLQHTINVKYGLALDAHTLPCVKHVDKRVLVTEARALMPQRAGYCDGAEPYDVGRMLAAENLDSPADVEETFIELFNFLYKRHTEAANG